LSYEYPDFIGVWHPAFISDEQFIFIGDINGDFGFNDQHADKVCGHMEGITDAGQIVFSFWEQMKEFYPELLKNWGKLCGACGLFDAPNAHICDENPLWEVIAWHQEQFKETEGIEEQRNEHEMHSDFIDILRKAVSQ
jgi:hypothetical protein